MTEQKVIDPQRIILPECCKNPDIDCKHVVNKKKEKEKQNIGL